MYSIQDGPKGKLLPNNQLHSIIICK